ncbi:MAG: 50S ribosomal protein L37ae [Candidatus Aenigmatarchaeota archaeon]|nr:50S ribosomal protein L37ae [Nanoarchaeota archaeon]
MSKTKKVGSSGRYGARYGRTLKMKIVDVEKTQKKKHRCPTCMKPGLKRVSSGIWACKKCGAKIAGKAYKPS